MAQHVPGVIKSFEAAADLSAKQYYLLKDGAAANTVDLASVKGGKVRGVLHNKPTSGAGAAVCLIGAGTSKVILGGTVARGDELINGTTGKAEKADANGQFVFGQALASGVSGDIIEVALHYDYEYDA